MNLTVFAAELEETRARMAILGVRVRIVSRSHQAQENVSVSSDGRIAKDWEILGL